MPRKTNPAIKQYKLKSGERRYKFQIYLGSTTGGKSVVTTRAGFKTYREASIVFDQLKLSGLKEHSENKQITVNELYRLWFESYKFQVKQSTANKNQQVYKNHIAPEFGDNPISRISVARIQRFADRKAQEIVKYKDVIRQLNIIFEYAQHLGYINDNPVNRILVPKKTARPRRDIENNVYTKKQLEAFLEAAKQRPMNVYTYFMILASTGLRKSEALALTWKDIDFRKSLINVNKTLALGMDNELIVQPPKSPKSIRKVPISKNLSKVLKEYRKEFKRDDTDKLFATRTGNYPVLSRPSNWLRQIYAANPRMKKITIHGFRHTFATLLVEETNVKPKTVQMLLGHENIQMTLDIYTHINAANKKEAKAVIDELNI